jgi:hypothetical protein
MVRLLHCSSASAERAWRTRDDDVLEHRKVEQPRVAPSRGQIGDRSPFDPQLSKGGRCA